MTAAAPHPSGCCQAEDSARQSPRFQYTGHGADPERQAAPHTHCTTVSRDNRYVLVNDLGLDRISVYHLDPHTAQLTPNTPPFYEALPGSGPRSFAFHPSGQVGLLTQRNCQHRRRPGLGW